MRQRLTKDPSACRPASQYEGHRCNRYELTVDMIGWRKLQEVWGKQMHGLRRESTAWLQRNGLYGMHWAPRIFDEIKMTQYLVSAPINLTA